MLSVIKYVLRTLLELLSEEDFKEFVNMAFDWVEKKVADTSTPYDDAILLPIIAKLRSLLNIP